MSFMDADFGLSQKADVIFCRNVIIYFDRPRQERIVQKLSANWYPGGTPSSATPRPCTTWMSHWSPSHRPSTGKPMLELESEVSDVYLHPGESYLARKPAIIRTILGSCVGVTFLEWEDRRRRPMPRPVAPVPDEFVQPVEPRDRPTLRGFLHSRPCPAVRRTGRDSYGGASQAVWWRRCAARRP